MAEAEARDVLRGAVDLHCHSGPNPLAREFDHVEAAQDGARLEMRGILAKSHHHNTVMDLLAMADRLAGVSTPIFGGIALNSWAGGINPEAVAMSLRMGGRAVWFPTLSSHQHLAHPPGRATPSLVELPNREVTIYDDRGRLLDDVLRVLDHIAENDALLSSGHMSFDEARDVFTEARARGVRRMVMSHPNHVVGASPANCLELVELGAYIEHEAGAFDPQGGIKWDPAVLHEWIDAVGAAHTVIASDLGQRGRPMPVDGLTRVCATLLERGVPAADVRTMTGANPAFLLGVDTERPRPADRRLTAATTASSEEETSG
ncbi:DUF6282 family protein [Pseudonocardia zijingensis]|jgi:hypothetical protein|uniref:Amidohydrolase family protein n=1 Tax=Pseudonocardia zijingensis TaxID=153376 RepID=A0ABN1PY50_9PSEU